MQIIMGILPLIIMVAIFYFLIILPDKKNKAKLLKMISELKKGDKVVLFAGIIGTVDTINDNGTLIIITQGSKMLIEKEAIKGLKDGY